MCGFIMSSPETIQQELQPAVGKQQYTNYWSCHLKMLLDLYIIILDNKQ